MILNREPESEARKAKSEFTKDFVPESEAVRAKKADVDICLGCEVV